MSNISSGLNESWLLITEVESRLDNVSLEVDEKLNSLAHKVNDRLKELELAVSRADSSMKGYVNNQLKR